METKVNSCIPDLIQKYGTQRWIEIWYHNKSQKASRWSNVQLHALSIFTCIIHMFFRPMHMVLLRYENIFLSLVRIWKYMDKRDLNFAKKLYLRKKGFSCWRSLLEFEFFNRYLNLVLTILMTLICTGFVCNFTRKEGFYNLICLGCHAKVLWGDIMNLYS